MFFYLCSSAANIAERRMIKMVQENKTGRVSDIAKQLGISHAVLYKLIKQGKLTGVKVSRGLHVNIEDARVALEAERATPRKKGGRERNWGAFSQFLKDSNEGMLTIELGAIRELIGSEDAKLEMLHYWDPYRAERGQAPGIRAIRDGGYELCSIGLEFCESIGLVGAIAVTVRKQ